MFVFKREVKKSISKTKSLIESYQAVVKAKKAVNDNDDEDNDTTSPRLLADIRTILKSINWDVQDLEETISKHYFCFKLIFRRFVLI